MTPEQYQEQYQSSPEFLSNIPSENAEFIREAAEEIGFSITVHDSPVPGNVSVWTNEPLSRDHGPFWQAYRQLKEAAKGESDDN